MQSLLHTYRARRNARISSPVRRQSQRHRYSAGAMETMKGEKRIIHWTFADDARDIGSVGRSSICSLARSHPLPRTTSGATEKESERSWRRRRRRTHEGSGRRLSFRAGAVAAACYHHREREGEGEREGCLSFCEVAALKLDRLTR